MWIIFHRDIHHPVINRPITHLDLYCLPLVSLYFATVEFAKGARDRIGEEDVTSRLVLNLVALGNGVVSRLAPGLLPGENLNVTDERL